MGAQQSKSNASDGAAGPTKTCYYELLGVEQTANDDEIKKAYRRQALRHHPDKNPENIEAATQKFAEIQAAYEILSNPDERAWYDSHRAAILRGVDPTELGEAPTEFRNVRLTSTNEVLALVGQFNSTVRFTDEKTGFFGCLHTMFSHLAEEELAVSEFPGDNDFEWPDFGTSKSSYDETVRPFYSVWTNFSTRKSFSWVEKWRLSDAPDRRVRRVMEKENQKFRQDAIREFNEAVRFLVMFARKRDPRYQRNQQTEAERQKAAKEASAAQSARSRAANLQNMEEYVLPEWAKSQADDPNNGDFSGDEEEEEEIVEEIECIVCNKTFKSENQFEAHERSKKHIKAVQQLKRDMQREEKLFTKNNKNAKTKPAQEASPSEEDVDGIVDNILLSGDEDHLPPANDQTDQRTLSDADSAATKPKVMTAEDVEKDVNIQNLTLDGTQEHDETAPKKIGKAKAKRMKKAAKESATEQESPSVS
ncbi:hypothetical protein TD95_002522 [Thielaviopsis punctulata]|uniref:J domain-containing protein n=1 Tax=Thielaviopsis punctulata TaxID=72032 RepID=A0A0F4ZHD8_9PEZI|nr:hypothetical protein TD95_002522 [Thielaviopsis punctulata]